MKVLITGASGFIGGQLSRKLQERGFSILKTTRNPASEDKESVYWNPDSDEIPTQALEGLEGVIHLAGENIASLRWTKAKKDRIFLSRVRGTWILSHVLLRLKTPPRFFFSASAVGYYGNRGDEILMEDSRQGDGFLAEVCGKWEEASNALKQKGVRVIHGRFGNVLDPSGGLLKKMHSMLALGIGLQMGSGHQWMSWISREDLIRAIQWALFEHPLEGAVNFCSPNPITQKEWAHSIAKLVITLPAPLVRLIFGQMGQELFLYSTRAKPQKLLESGFKFLNPTIGTLRL